MRVKVLKPISKGKAQKGDPTLFHKIGSIAEMPDKEFPELKRLGYVEKAKEVEPKKVELKKIGKNK